ncbi:hypothetical protein ACI79J_13990 [Geodermatophilus sp. SYSU D01062]
MAGVDWVRAALRATFRVAGVRADGLTAPQSHIVGVEFRRDEETHRTALLVVEEDGGLRVCGTP